MMVVIVEHCLSRAETPHLYYRLADVTSVQLLADMAIGKFRCSDGTSSAHHDNESTILVSILVHNLQITLTSDQRWQDLNGSSSNTHTRSV